MKYGGGGRRLLISLREVTFLQDQCGRGLVHTHRQQYCGPVPPTRAPVEPPGVENRNVLIIGQNMGVKLEKLLV